MATPPPFFKGIPQSAKKAEEITPGKRVLPPSVGWSGAEWHRLRSSLREAPLLMNMPRPTAKMDDLDVDLAGAGEKPRLAHYRVAPLSRDAVNSQRDASLNGEGFERGRRESPLGFTLRWTAADAATSRRSSVINVSYKRLCIGSAGSWSVPRSMVRGNKPSVGVGGGRLVSVKQKSWPP